jgi:hypothetical protein
MVQINITPKEMQNGDVVTSYTNTVDASGATFTFLKPQETVILKNKGTKNISYTIGSNTGNLLPSESGTTTGKQQV